VRILELRVPTPRLAEQRAFWSQKLDLPVTGEPDGTVTVSAGASTLRLEPDPAGPGSPLHFAFNIPENRYADAVAWVHDVTEPILRDGRAEVPFPNWNADAVYFLDPDGNVLELIARHDLPNAAEPPFGPDALLEISEVGMPVPEVDPALRYLEERLGLSQYSGDRERFAAMGDEHGLFIVVPEQRAWFPTDRVATAARLAVTVLGDAAGEHQINPSRTANAIAWERDRALSLVRTSWMTFFTVRSE
jgi:catechol-2,3-dioxygenase